LRQGNAALEESHGGYWIGNDPQAVRQLQGEKANGERLFSDPELWQILGYRKSNTSYEMIQELQSMAYRPIFSLSQLIPGETCVDRPHVSLRQSLAMQLCVVLVSRVTMANRKQK
jgi:hypothetical protein